MWKSPETEISREIMVPKINEIGKGLIQGYSTFHFFMEVPNNCLLPETDVSNESY